MPGEKRPSRDKHPNKCQRLNLSTLLVSKSDRKTATAINSCYRYILTDQAIAQYSLVAQLIYGS